MRCPEIASELVQRVVANEDAGCDVHHTVFGLELPNCGPSARRITLTENLRKVAAE
jgi:hypothetical protein